MAHLAVYEGEVCQGMTFFDNLDKNVSVAIVFKTRLTGLPC